MNNLKFINYLSYLKLQNIQILCSYIYSKVSENFNSFNIKALLKDLVSFCIREISQNNYSE